MRRIAAFGITAVLALGAVACSDDSGDDESSDSTEEASDTGDLGGVSIPEGTVAPANEEFCTDYRAAAAGFINATARPESADLEELQSNYADLAASAPEEVAAEMAAVSDAFDEVEEAGEMLSAPSEVREASDAIEEWVVANCLFDPAQG